MIQETHQVNKKLKELEKRIETLENALRPKRKRTITGKKSILDHVEFLKSEGFFDQPKTLKEIVERLAQESYHYRQQSLTNPLQRAVRQGMLGRIKKNRKWAWCKR